MQSQPKIGERIIVALDFKTLEEARALIELLAPFGVLFKIGLELINSVGGPQAVAFVRNLGGEVFYDIKLHDIPNTVGAASQAIADLGVAMFNVHASGGVEMMQAAVTNKGSTKVLAVTVLTSLTDSDCGRIYGHGPRGVVERNAYMALEAGVDGIICSPQELQHLSHRGPRGVKDLEKIIPGVRPEWAPSDDQKRIMTPGEAIMAGATALVIGRPITRPPQEVGSPVKALELIIIEMQQALRV